MHKVKSINYFRLIVQLFLALLVLSAGYFSGELIRKYYDEYSSNKSTESEQRTSNSNADSIPSLGNFENKLIIGSETILVPDDNASDELKAEFSKKLMEVAQPVNQLEINDCKLTPNVIKVKQEEMLTIDNTGDNSSTLVVEAQEWIIPAQSKKDFELSFQNGAGIYGMSCDGKLAGMIYVID